MESESGGESKEWNEGWRVRVRDGMRVRVRNGG